MPPPKFSHLLVLLSISSTVCYMVPGSCPPGLHYDTSAMACAACPGNSSTVPSEDGFSCSCDATSIPSGPASCRLCNATEVRSTDGMSCVPRRCQRDKSGKLVCRKCPADYVSVTQNYDGSPMREVQCVKCSRGYRAQDNRCVHCESCTCSKDQLVVNDRCLPKTFVMKRPKHEAGNLHPNALLDIVKHEYFCIEGDVLACRMLIDECVRSFYSTDNGGPCRLWLQGSSVPKPKGLPKLLIDSSEERDSNYGEAKLSASQGTFSIVLAAHHSNGSLRFLADEKHLPCFMPQHIRVGYDVFLECHMNKSDLARMYGKETYAPYLNIEGKLVPIPVSIRKPDGALVQERQWYSNKFRRYFVLATPLSTTANITVTVYLNTLIVYLSVERDKASSGHLRIVVTMEAQYSSKYSASGDVTVTFKVQNRLPSAGILRSLEISGGVLGALLCLYGVAQWRGVLRRGGVHVSLVPMLAGCVADTLHFSAVISSAHALAAEAGALGLTLPLTKAEDHILTAFVYSAFALKLVKILWVNWKQCTNDIFFLDWSEYNPPEKESPLLEKAMNWRTSLVAREWSHLQTKRRVSPGHIVAITLIILHFLSPWQVSLPPSVGYTWATATLVFWSSTIALYAIYWINVKLFGAPYDVIKKACSAAGVSLFVFQEEYYAHYVHGRNDEALDVRALSGPLSVCRVVCAPQLRVVYRQLTTTAMGTIEGMEARRALLSKFLAAFFERAVDGMSWIASERSLLERLLDVELSVREPACSGALLYDADTTAPPSCLAVTWHGEEWSLLTFDAMLLSCVLVATRDLPLAAFITLVVWQVLKRSRSFFGNSNIKEKTDMDTFF